MMTQNLIINEELKNLLPPLSPEEFAGLEESICKDGCLAPLIEWNGILVDGHHRYEICTKHQIPYAVKSVVLDNLDDAKLWIWKHQENRRNLTAYHRAEIALKLKEAIAVKAKERQKGGQGGVLLPANLPEAKETREELAGLAGMSPRSLAKAEFIAEHADEETKEKLRQGVKGTSIDREYNRLKAEEKTMDSEASPLESTEQPSEQASQFRPGSLPTKKYVGETQLKPIPRDRPDILVANLIAFFPEEFVMNTAFEVFKMMRNRKGKKFIKPFALEIHKEYGRGK